MNTPTPSQLRDIAQVADELADILEEAPPEYSDYTVLDAAIARGITSGLLPDHVIETLRQLPEWATAAVAAIDFYEDDVPFDDAPVDPFDQEYPDFENLDGFPTVTLRPVDIDDDDDDTTVDVLIELNNVATSLVMRLDTVIDRLSAI